MKTREGDLVSSEQVCALTFGSWTFKKEEVQISYLMGRKQVVDFILRRFPYDRFNI